MTYYDIVNKIIDYGYNQMFIQDVDEGDIYEYLNSTDHKYPTIFLTVQSITSEENFDTINCTLFYIDRLTDTEDNKLYVQSNGISTLKSLLLEMSEEEPQITINSNTYTPFRTKYKDVTAGAYSTLSISYPNDTICSQSQNITPA